MSEMIRADQRKAVERLPLLVIASPVRPVWCRIPANASRKPTGRIDVDIAPVIGTPYPVL